MYTNRPRRNWGIIAVVSLLGISNISMINTLVSHKCNLVCLLPNKPFGSSKFFNLVKTLGSFAL